MISNFPAALKLVLQDEGGNDDDPADHGGRTSRGITQREYDAWRQLHGHGGEPAADVWAASQDEITAIYHDEYWEPYCDSFPVGVDYLYFDMAVNAGPHRAAVLLQRALGVADDGRIGPITKLSASKADPKQLITNYTNSKRAFYISLHQPKFSKGWLNRCDHVQKSAMAMLPQEAA